MRYAGMNKNDFAAAPGVSVTFFTQGCPHRCRGCHNPETWDFAGGKEFTPAALQEVIEALTANGIERSLAIMGGEPLCPENSLLTLMIIQEVKKHLPQTKIYVWSGYYYDQLLVSSDPHVMAILDSIDVLIDGPYIEAERDITLPMRGSRNQSIINLTK